jgi:hypothetical protein
MYEKEKADMNEAFNPGSSREFDPIVLISANQFI